MTQNDDKWLAYILKHFKRPQIWTTSLGPYIFGESRLEYADLLKMPFLERYET